MCGKEHQISNNLFFPHLIKAYLPNKTAIDPKLMHYCWMVNFFLFKKNLFI